MYQVQYIIKWPLKFIKPHNCTLCVNMELLGLFNNLVNRLYRVSALSPALPQSLSILPQSLSILPQCLSILINPYQSLSILINPYQFFLNPYQSLSILPQSLSILPQSLSILINPSSILINPSSILINPYQSLSILPQSLSILYLTTLPTLFVTKSQALSQNNGIFC